MGKAAARKPAAAKAQLAKAHKPKPAPTKKASETPRVRTRAAAAKKALPPTGSKKAKPSNASAARAAGAPPPAPQSQALPSPAAQQKAAEAARKKAAAAFATPQQPRPVKWPELFGLPIHITPVGGGDPIAVMNLWSHPAYPDCESRFTFEFLGGVRVDQSLMTKRRKKIKSNDIRPAGLMGGAIARALPDQTEVLELKGAHFFFHGDTGWEDVGEPWWGDETLLNESRFSLSLRVTGEADDAGRPMFDGRMSYTKVGTFLPGDYGHGCKPKPEELELDSGEWEVQANVGPQPPSNRGPGPCGNTRGTGFGWGVESEEEGEDEEEEEEEEEGRPYHDSPAALPWWHMSASESDSEGYALEDSDGSGWDDESEDYDSDPES